MKYTHFGIIIAAVIASTPVYAVDCGEKPNALPTVPTGTNMATESIRAARVAVVSFSEKVDNYITCMDTRAPTILPYLTKEQKARWEEDLADLHDRRRDLQNDMNLAIRAFRKAARNQ